MLRVALVLLTDVAVRVHGRPYHNNEMKKHKHTYLEFCADDTTVVANACVHSVPNHWPNPAIMESECVEAAYPHAAVGTTDSTCTASPSGKNLFTPITPRVNTAIGADGYWRRGADVDTLTDNDRIQCRDGQIFSTGCDAPLLRGTIPLS
jgi:hypothetical protein